VAHRVEERTIFWYLDDQYAGSSCAVPMKAIELKSGWHELKVIDGFGNRDQAKFFVDTKVK
jgi:hypothetical protein